MKNNQGIRNFWQLLIFTLGKKPHRNLEFATIPALPLLVRKASSSVFERNI